jgi:hypothetical protein
MGHGNKELLGFSKSFDEFGDIRNSSPIPPPKYETLTVSYIFRKDFDSEKWNVKLMDGQTRQVEI